MQGVRQKSTAGVSGIRRGHFFAVRRSNCPHIFKRVYIVPYLHREREKKMGKKERLLRLYKKYIEGEDKE